MSESKVNMSLDEVIKFNRKERQASRGRGTRGAGMRRGKVFHGARGGRGNVGMTRGIPSRGVAPRGAFNRQRRSAPTGRAGSRMNLNSIRGNINAGAPQNRMLNLMVKRAVKRALATTSRPRQGALNGGGILARRGLVRKAVGGGILRRVGGRGAFVGAAGLNRVQPQSRVIQRRVAPQHLIVQRSPMVARRFQRIASPDVMNRPMVVRQQTFPARARPQAQTVVVRRIVQAPPQRVQRTIVQRTISRQPQRQQIVERVIPRVRQQQVIRRPVQQQVVRVQRVIQRPQQQIQYVQQRQRGGNRGGVRRLQNRVQMERVNPRFEYENSPRIIVRHRRGFQNY